VAQFGVIVIGHGLAAELLLAGQPSARKETARCKRRTARSSVPLPAYRPELDVLRGNDQMTELPTTTPAGFEHAARIRGEAAIRGPDPSGRSSWPWVTRHAPCRYVSLDPDH